MIGLELKSLLLNRFVFVFGSIAVMVVLWNIYVGLNDDGEISGRVIGPDHEPVSGAEITVEVNELNNYAATPATVRTDSRGQFQLSGVKFFNFNIIAKKDGMKNSPKYNYRLYFRSQNFELPAPLVLQPQ